MFLRYSASTFSMIFVGTFNKLQRPVLDVVLGWQKAEIDEGLWLEE
jgi:hypothetical protein